LVYFEPIVKKVVSPFGIQPFSFLDDQEIIYRLVLPESYINIFARDSDSKFPVNCQQILILREKIGRNLSLVMTVKKLFYTFLLSALSLVLTAQVAATDTVRSVLTEYTKLVKAGRLKEAVGCLSGLLVSGTPLTPKEQLGVNNNLGIIHKNLGQYDLALKYYDAAESVYLNSSFADNSFLMSIYGNKVNIYSMKGDFNKALEYAERAIRSVPESNGTALFKQQTNSSLLLNEGIIYYQLNDFNPALIAFKKSISLKNRYNLPGKENVYKNLANTYAKTGDNLLADKYFNLGIRQSETVNRNSPIKLDNIYFEYCYFLFSINENAKALSVIQKVLSISLAGSDEKNQLTSNCYQLMGEYYGIIKDYQKALTYYQKALISGSKGFNDPRTEANPLIVDITPNLWQLRVLRRKAEVLAILADEEGDKSAKINFLTASLETSNLAAGMTNTIRVDYQDEETRLIFGEKQKNVFVASIESALKLYDLTGKKSYLYLAYQTTQQYKANELKYEIARNNSFISNEVPDSLRNKEKELQRDIAAYNALVRNESALPAPDSAKMAYWKDQQFDLNRVLEKTAEHLERKYPRFTDKLKRGNIVSIGSIQASLKSGESLIEYVISEKSEKGDRKLYAFVITPQDLVCHTELIDSTMAADFSGLKSQLNSQFSVNNSIDNYNQMNQRLFEAYTILIQPIEKYFTGKELIIIPDEEISYLPFDAFITSWKRKTKINYAELAYLIRDYSISYGYSTNTLWNNKSNAEINPKVIGFAPDYSNTGFDDGKKYKTLKSNSLEIEGILDNFHGTVLKAGQATIANFRSSVNSGAILHLAMHAELDTSQVGSSGLIFSPDIKSPGNYRLNNYEIGQMSINSPMVVLSACNTGAGKLYSGEGLMSLARNFVLAGVPSVVETLWPVEDVAGSKIMGDFYKYLSEGKPKNTALRLAKLDYINNSSPSFVNPRFWAAYTLMGDVSAIKKIWWKELWIIIPLIVLTSIVILLLIYWLRFLRIT
jgi:CHAT domain-containing protein